MFSVGSDTHFVCNCDSLRNNMIDEGILTSLSQLPVQSLNYGDQAWANEVQIQIWSRFCIFARPEFDLDQINVWFLSGQKRFLGEDFVQTQTRLSTGRHLDQTGTRN